LGASADGFGSGARVGAGGQEHEAGVDAGGAGSPDDFEGMDVGEVEVDQTEVGWLPSEEVHQGGA
jgi:hypothetical protein